MIFYGFFYGCSKHICSSSIPVICLCSAISNTIFTFSSTESMGPPSGTLARSDASELVDSSGNHSSAGENSHTS